MEKLKANKAITLVAVMITVIIMLILAGIMMNFIIGEQGIIARITQTKEEHKKAEQDEKKDLEELYSQMKIATNDDSQVTIKIEDLKELIQQQVEEKINELNQANQIAGIKENSIIMTATNQDRSISNLKLNSFSRQLEPNFEEYFLYDETTGNMICQKEGWYQVNLSLRIVGSMASGRYCDTYLRLLINEVNISEAICIINGTVSEANDSNSITVYLKKGDVVTINKQVQSTALNEGCNAKVRLIKL